MAGAIILGASYDVEEYFRRFPLAFNGLGYLTL